MINIKRKNKIKRIFYFGIQENESSLYLFQRKKRYNRTVITTGNIVSNKQFTEFSEYLRLKKNI